MDAFLNCSGDVSPRAREAVVSLLNDRVIRSAVYSRQTASTNSDAMSEVATGDFDTSLLPRLHVTDRQSAGRGRQGNQWHAAGDAIALSLIVKFPKTAIPLSLIVGIAVAEAIEHVCAPCRIGLKWPNDICSRNGPQGRSVLSKLGGILIENSAAAAGLAVIGVGLNVNDSPTLDETAGFPTVSVAEATQRPIDRARLLGAMIQSIAETVRAEPIASAEILPAYRSRCVLSGTMVTLRQATETFQGICQGIGDDGALRVLVDGRLRSFQSGEVQTVRRA